MKATVIKDSEISELKISSLPTRPTAPKSTGGAGYGAKEMKEAFDRLPLFIIERFNALLEDVSAIGEDSLAAAMKTGIRDGHTLSELFSDVTDGALAGYLIIGEKSLACHLLQIREDISELKAAVAALAASGEEDVCQE